MAKVCRECSAPLVIGENWSEGRRRNHNNICKSCIPKTTPDQNLWNNWKIRRRDYNALLKSQGGGCAICGKQDPVDRNFAVDHVHGSDPVDIRGLLCTRCNNGLGNFMDNSQSLQNAIHYLNCDYHKIKRAA